MRDRAFKMRHVFSCYVFLADIFTHFKQREHIAYVVIENRHCLQKYCVNTAYLSATFSFHLVENDRVFCLNINWTPPSE